MRKTLVAWCVLVSLGLASVAEAKTVNMDYDEFVKMLANVDVLKNHLATANQQIVLHKRGAAEREHVITLQKKQIEELKASVEAQKKAGASQEELIKGLQKKLEVAEKDEGNTFLPWGVATAAVLLFLVK